MKIFIEIKLIKKYFIKFDIFIWHYKFDSLWILVSSRKFCVTKKSHIENLSDHKLITKCINRVWLRNFY